MVLQIEQVCKPNFVSEESDGNHSSRPFVTKRLKRPTRKRMRGRIRANERAAQITFPYLVLHHEEFTWPHLLPNAPVRSYLRDALRLRQRVPAPFHPSPKTELIKNYPQISVEAGMLSVALVVNRLKPAARTLSGSLPYGVRTFLLIFYEKAIARLVQFARPYNLSKQCWTNPMMFGFSNKHQFPISTVSPASKTGSGILPFLISFKLYSVGTSNPCSFFRRIVTFFASDFFRPPEARMACVKVIPW